MKLQGKFREMVKYRAGALCLIGILSATFLHTTTFMSQFFYDNILPGRPCVNSIHDSSMSCHNQTNNHQINHGYSISTLFV